MWNRGDRTRGGKPPVGRLAAALLAFALASGCSLLPEEEEMLQPPVNQKQQEDHQTAAVKRGNLEQYLSSSATVVSDKTVTAAFGESGGRIKQVFVAEGDTVAAGAPIAELDTGDLKTRIQLQKLAVEKQQILYSDTVKSGVSEEDKRLSKLSLDRERLILDSQQKQYDKSLLRAPTDGIVTYLSAPDPSETISAGQTIAIVADPKAVNLVYETSAPASIAAVQPGTEVDITFHDRPYKGKVIQTPSTAPKTDDEKLNQRNAKALIIAFAGEKPTVDIGDYADFKLFVEKRENVLIIPRSALRNFLGRTSVQIIDNGRIKEVDVQAGLATSQEIEIVKGLEEGQQVVTDP